jgi:hypothetical protein
MPVSEYDPNIRARDVRVTDETLTVVFVDGRTISAPLEWYPRLHRATEVQRANWQLIGEGHGVHWPDVDEDIGTIMLIEGLPSLEFEKARTR